MFGSRAMRRSRAGPSTRRRPSSQAIRYRRADTQHNFDKPDPQGGDVGLTGRQPVRTLREKIPAGLALPPRLLPGSEFGS
jgi:hypothetical protein